MSRWSIGPPKAGVIALCLALASAPVGATEERPAAITQAWRTRLAAFPSPSHVPGLAELNLKPHQVESFAVLMGRAGLSPEAVNAKAQSLTARAGLALYALELKRSAETMTASGRTPSLEDLKQLNAPLAAFAVLAEQFPEQARALDAFREAVAARLTSAEAAEARATIESVGAAWSTGQQTVAVQTEALTNPSPHPLPQVGEGARRAGEGSPAVMDLALRFRDEPSALFEHEGYRELKPEQKRFIASALLPAAGLLSVLIAPQILRPIVADGSELMLEGFPGEKDLAVRWQKGLSEPALEVGPSARTLSIPEEASFEDAGGWTAAVRRWLLGSSLHPFVATREVSAARRALGDAAFVPRQVQEEGIAAGRAALDRGDSSFLYTAPTGTGKSYVIEKLIEHSIATSKLPLHIVTANQTLLTEQLARDLEPLEKKGKVRIVLWGGKNKAESIEDLLAQARHAQAEGRPILLVSTTQSLVARFYRRVEDGTGARSELRPEAAELKALLGTVFFDEAHHAGAETAARLIADLTAGSAARKLGVTATPLHSLRGIQELFDHHGFWAYLDTPESYLKTAGQGERELDAILDQLSAAIQNGDLTPLDKFYAIRPQSLVPEGASLFRAVDPEAETPRYAIDPAFYPALIERLAPLFLKHRRGFVAANSIEEAKALTEALNATLPGRHFAVLHSGMDAEERDKVLAGLREGALNFIVTVRMLDEGLNFPDFTLYVDVNQGVGPRQFLQRWGRITRIFPGKEGVEIALLMDHLDEEVVRENLIFLDRHLQGRFQLPNRQATKTATAASPVAAEAALQQTASLEGLSRLMEDMREFFTRAQRDPPLQRCNQFVERHGRLPQTRRESSDPGAYQYWHDLTKKPESEWPEGMSEKFRQLLRDKVAEDAATISPLERCNRFVELHGRLPQQSGDNKDARAYQFWSMRVRKLPESDWPEGMSERFRQLLRDKIAEDAATVSPLERCDLFVERHGRLPQARGENRDEGAYAYWSALKRKPESAWPEGMSDILRRLLRDKIAEDAQEEPLIPPLDRCNQFVERQGRLPQATGMNNDAAGYSYWYRLRNKPESEWPEGMSEKFKQLLREKIAEDAATSSPLERCNQFVGLHGRLPQRRGENNDEGAYAYWSALKRKPESEWPEGMSEKFKQLLREKIAEDAATSSPLERCNLFVERHGRLPQARGENKDDAAYHFWYALKKKPESGWPEGMSERFRQLLREKIALDKAK